LLDASAAERRYVERMMTVRVGLPLTTLLPAFAEELKAMMRVVQRHDLAAQVPDLVVRSRCTCGDLDCAHFYTEALPLGAYGPSHSNVQLPAASGLVVLDMVSDRVVAIEVLDRPDVKGPLDEHFPPPAAPPQTPDSK
jgi:hypothetical protein